MRGVSEEVKRAAIFSSLNTAGGWRRSDSQPSPGRNSFFPRQDHHRNRTYILRKAGLPLAALSPVGHAPPRVAFGAPKQITVLLCRISL